jgi:DNA helicase-2/ATP-dependent DNA helicase PcrA
MTLPELNPSQKEAVTHEGGPLLVLAPAGSGKTRVVIARLLHLFERHGWADDRILAVTFTRKAAREMVSRIAESRPAFAVPWVGTFHSVASRMLRQHAERAGLPREFAIVDGSDQRQILRDLIESSGLPEKEHDPKSVLLRISQWKTTGISPEEAERTTFGPFRAQAGLYRSYEARLASQKALDFDDLLIRLTRLLRDDPDVRAFYRNQFEHILVDEYQDTNAAQEALLRILSRDGNNVTVVGDDDQSIYRFRGSDVGHILSFARHYPGARRVVLSVNYRSTRMIVGASKAMIAGASARFDKDMSSAGEKGLPVVLKKVGNESDEARHIARRIRQRVSGGGRYRDQAVLFRMNAQAQTFSKVFAEHGIPFQVRAGADGFFSRREIRDLLAYLRLSVNPFDRVSLSRVLNVPQRGFGDRTRDRLDVLSDRETLPAERLLALLSGELPKKASEAARRFSEDLSEARLLAEKGSGVSRLLAFWSEWTGYEGYLEGLGEPEDVLRDRRENVMELSRMADRFDRSWRDAQDRSPTGAFLEELALSQEDPGDPESGEVPDRVSLLTIHQAKGLEFSHVYLTGAEEGILPLKGRGRVDVEEERRLFYVAMTRARETLEISYCLTRQLFGRTDAFKPSRFLFDLPSEFTEGDRPSVSGSHGSRETGVPADRSGTSSSARPSPFRPQTGRPDAASPAEPQAPPRVKRPEWIGRFVRHARFGQGIVEEATGEGNDLELSIRFDGLGVKRLMERFANLTVVPPSV